MATSSWTCTLLFILLIASVHAQQKPNIVLILSDDAGYADFGFQSDRLIPTPHIDRIAREGIRFTNGYVTGSVCSPSRAGMLTGIYQAKFGHTTNFIQGVRYDQPYDSLGLPINQKLVGDYLKPLGYTTGLIGKWHLGNAAHFHPNRRGFDHFWGFLWGSSHYYTDKPRFFEENERELNASAYPYTTDAIGNQSAAFIEANAQTPFFLFVSFNAPHSPMEAKPELFSRFLAQLKDSGRALNAALTHNMDENVGKIFSALEKKGLLKNTILVFTNDNGGQIQMSYADNYPLRGMKADVYEGGIRVPMAMRWPGEIPSGTVVDMPVTSLDFLPTFLKAAGARLSDPQYRLLDGRDLHQMINRPNPSDAERSLFWYVNVNKGCIRKGKYKMLFQPGLPPELYDLDADVSERNNLTSTLPAIAQELEKEFQEWAKTLPPPKWRAIPAKPNRASSK